MQFYRGDAAQCVGAADGHYFVDIKPRQYRLAINNYTLRIPLEEKYATLQNNDEVLKDGIRKLIKSKTEFCRANVQYYKFPFTVQNGTVMVTPIVEGQMLALRGSHQVLPRNYEVSRHSKYGYRICYPSNITVDYIDVKPYDTPGVS